MRRLVRRLTAWVTRRRLQSEIADELEFHRAAIQQAFERDGLSPHDAAAASRRAMGNMTLAREDARGLWTWTWLESVALDVRYAARSLRRDAGFTLLATAALGAAVGLNTSVFAAFNGIMWRPWPVPDADRVVMAVRPGGASAFSLAEYQHIASHTSTFAGLAASRCLDGVSDGCTLQMDDTPFEAEFVSRNFFDVLRVGMSRGAGFGGSRAGSADVVISDAAWRRQFSADPAIIGRVIRLDDVPFTVVGVTRPGFTGTHVNQKDAWIPLDAAASLRPDQLFDDEKRFAAIAGRLAAVASRAQAEAELDTLSRQFHAARARADGGVRLIDTTFIPARGTRNNATSVFGLMLLAGVLVLGLACANVGNLLLARSAVRQREVAVRLAIGASRARIVRQLLTECVLLSILAAGLGLAIAFRLPRFLLSQIAGPLSFRVEPDWRVIAYAVGVAVAACVAFGLAPALHGSRAQGPLGTRDRNAALRPPASGVRLRAALLTAQVAIAIVLLVSAGLIVRGVHSIGAADPGFDMRGITAISLQLPASYETARVRAFARRMLDEAPAVLSDRPIGLAGVVPFGASGHMWTTVGDAPDRQQDVLAVEASPGYFDVLGIPIVLGRTFDAADAARKSVVINERLARDLWPGESPLGRTFEWRGPRRVVGVAKDVRHYPFALRLTLPTLYTPIDGRTVPYILVRGIDPASSHAIAAAATRIEPRARLHAAALADNLDAQLSRSRTGARLASLIGAIALVLATLGVFSVFAHTVEQRKREIGIRIALGAGPSQILRGMVRSSATPLLAGTVVGVAASIAAARVLRAFLYGLSPLDPMAYGAAAAVIAIAAGVATVHPARRATRIDPAVALRCE